MSILDDKREITEKYLEENGWEKTSYMPLMNQSNDIPSTIHELKWGYDFTTNSIIWKKRIIWSRSHSFRAIPFNIIYNPQQKIMLSISTIQTHATIINDIDDMNIFIQTLKDIWIPQYFKMFD